MKLLFALIVVSPHIGGCVPIVSRVDLQPTLPPATGTEPLPTVVKPIDYMYETRGYENFSLIEKASFYRTVSNVSILASGLAFRGMFIIFNRSREDLSKDDESNAISLVSIGAAFGATALYSYSLSNAATFHLEASGFKVTW